MNEKTKEEYRKLAKHFYKQNGIEKPTAKTVSDALKQCAADYQPGYWRRLRTALALVAKESGFYKAADQIKATKNPMTADPKQRKSIKKKQARQKSIKAADEQQLLSYLADNEEITVFAAVTLVRYLGCRPAELRQLKFITPRHISIPSAKKTKDGTRGLDRLFKIENSALFTSLKEHHQRLINAPYADPVRYVQKRLDNLTHKLWPKRKVRPSLYTWRHQLGADLKASDMPPEEIAAIMGHQSVSSVEVYGNPRSAQHSRNYLKPDKGIVRQVQKRNQHRLTKHKDEPITLNNISRWIKQNHHAARGRPRPDIEPH